MESFLLLGEIPGTTIVITFGMWAIFFSGLVLVGTLLWLRRHQQLLSKLPTFLAQHIAL